MPSRGTSFMLRVLKASLPICTAGARPTGQRFGLRLKPGRASLSSIPVYVFWVCGGWVRVWGGEWEKGLGGQSWQLCECVCKCTFPQHRWSAWTVHTTRDALVYKVYKVAVEQWSHLEGAYIYDYFCRFGGTFEADTEEHQTVGEPDTCKPPCCVQLTTNQQTSPAAAYSSRIVLSPGLQDYSRLLRPGFKCLGCTSTWGGTSAVWRSELSRRWIPCARGLGTSGWWTQMLLLKGESILHKWPLYWQPQATLI